jgi:ABC-type bacteriocin/lantibiotic exporter with double-glycine peptidase domain
MSGHKLPSAAEFRDLLRAVLGPEKHFLWVIVIYSGAISLLSLAIPISVQLLIDSVANTGMLSAVVTLGLVLFGLLFLSGLLFALRAWCMELFNRRLFSRLTSEISMVGLLSPAGWFEPVAHRALFNRFFDIMTVKKNTPYLLSQCFTLLFQSILGFIVVSLYHSYFLVFSLVLIWLIWMVWLVWGWKATEAGFELSEAKHETASWLQNMAANSDFLKTSRLQAYALQSTDGIIEHYLAAQKRHFRFSFAQLISFLLLYALASAALLGIGGWLVLQGQMTLGQLVSAELILSAIFYGLPQLAGYLDYYYDLCAAVEELSRFNHVDSEEEFSDTGHINPGGALQADNLVFDVDGQLQSLSCMLQPGIVARVYRDESNCTLTVGKVLARELSSLQGTLQLGDCDLLDCPMPMLREALLQTSRIRILPMPVRRYLQLASPDSSEGRIRDVLTGTGLMEAINRLPGGMEAILSPRGLPLSSEQSLRLRLAFALLARPAVVVLDEVCDSLRPRDREQIIDMFIKQGAIVLYGGDATLAVSHQDIELDAVTGPVGVRRSS